MGAAASARAAVLHDLHCTVGQLSTGDILGSRRSHSPFWTACATTRIIFFSTCPGGYSSRHRRVSRSLCPKLHIVATNLLLALGPSSPGMYSTKFLPLPPPGSSGYQIFPIYLWTTRIVDSWYSQAARGRNCFPVRLAVAVSARTRKQFLPRAACDCHLSIMRVAHKYS